METKLEKKIEEIEGIVKKLEAEETDLDDSIKMYEKGITLIKECEKIIGNYEEKIRNVLKEEENE
ncbi:MAG: exodeoxyribonuclease VII small subunit [candidate division WOR-3 bacterium]|nr:exodeoxyribonuclease VII small subunit [candidate division WOR-3 bacterium]